MVFVDLQEQHFAVIASPHALWLHLLDFAEHLLGFFKRQLVFVEPIESLEDFGEQALDATVVVQMLNKVFAELTRNAVDRTKGQLFEEVLRGATGGVPACWT
jgi:hypothetical protein